MCNVLQSERFYQMLRESRFADRATKVQIIPMMCHHSGPEGGEGDEEDHCNSLMH